MNRMIQSTGKELQTLESPSHSTRHVRTTVNRTDHVTDYWNRNVPLSFLLILHQQHSMPFNDQHTTNSRQNPSYDQSKEDPHPHRRRQKPEMFRPPQNWPSAPRNHACWRGTCWWLVKSCQGKQTPLSHIILWGRADEGRRNYDTKISFCLEKTRLTSEDLMLGLEGSRNWLRWRNSERF